MAITVLPPLLTNSTPNTSRSQSNELKGAKANEEDYCLMSITNTGQVLEEENPLEEWCICAERAAGSVS